MTDATKLPEHIRCDQGSDGAQPGAWYRKSTKAGDVWIDCWEWTADDLRAIAAHMDAQAGYGEGVGGRCMPWPVSQFGPDDTSGEYDIQVRTPHSLIIVSISGDGQLRDARQVSGYSVFRPTAALAQPAAAAAPGGGFLHPCHGSLTDRATIQRILDGSTLTVGRTGVDAVEFDPEDEDSFVPQRPEPTGGDAVERVADFLYCLKGGKTWGYDYADSERDAKKLLRAIGRGEK